MSLVLLLLAVVGAGAVLSVQAAINGRLGQSVGVLRSSLLTFVVGAVITALLIVFFEPAQAVSLMEVPKWQLSGALFGVTYMLVMVGAVPRIGAGHRMAAAATARSACAVPATCRLRGRAHAARRWRCAGQRTASRQRGPCVP